MFTFETADQKEVRRFRIAQFNGRATTIKSGGSTITGHVEHAAVLEDHDRPLRAQASAARLNRATCVRRRRALLIRARRATGAEMSLN